MAQGEGLHLAVCGKQVRPTPAFGLAGAYVFHVIMRVLLEHDSYSHMPLLMPTTVIGCGPSLCLTKDKTCKATAGTI